MKGKWILSILWFLNSTSQAQEYESYCKSFSAQYQNFYKTDKINYPGDANIDVTYYKLDLNITYSPQYLIGKVTVKALSSIND